VCRSTNTLTTVGEQVGGKHPWTLVELTQVVGDGRDGSAGHRRLGLNHEEGESAPVDVALMLVTIAHLFCCFRTESEVLADKGNRTQ